MHPGRVFKEVYKRLLGRHSSQENPSFTNTSGSIGSEPQDFSRILTSKAQIPEIVALFQKVLDQSLQPSRILVFLRDPLGDHFTSQPGEDGEKLSDLTFSVGSPLPRKLENLASPLILSQDGVLPEDLLEEKARLALLGCQVLLPFDGCEDLIGWACLGPSRTGEGYKDQDIRYMEEIAWQTSIALDRGMAARTLAQRAHEMNVLRRVSQGINITLAFDDLLELIYAQCTQLVPATDFRITLQDPYLGHLGHSFYVENDDRLGDRENIPLPGGVGLDRLIIERKRPLVSEDYEKDCNRQAVRPEMKGVFAWMGVPLIAGSETVGLLSLGSRDPDIIYTNEQAAGLQAVADQAAGAIVKIRLLAESGKKTKQLVKLSEVSRTLTSTLELKGLFTQILSSAVEMMNCEGGRLSIVDPSTGELVIEAVEGLGTELLLEERQAIGKGMPGQVVGSGQPVIANHTRETNLKQDKSPKEKDLLAVPMTVKDRVVGVIEVINKKDRLPFHRDDQELLTAYASQAATAVENARLYSLTDQALAARVEELSVMQQIDRELNASLEVKKAMNITLKWAMQQTSAEAGLVGWVDGNSVLVVESAGTSNPSGDNSCLVFEPEMERALKSGLPLASRATGKGLLPDSKTQIIVPIQRETGPLAALVLESRQEGLPSEEIIAFLSRLSDHAAIAITNAQLYAEVQAANLAKSEFVSFVSHELKTPMTSIKGFTDLLAAQAVGPVNEAQSNFLSTIRSNVDRMATLVSDLADISRIEAGRLQLDFTSVNLPEVVNEVTRSFRGQIEAKEQNLLIDIQGDLPRAWGDRNRLIQIVTNLISNAHKYSPIGGDIFLKISCSPNNWDPVGAPQVLHTAVKDEGFGISEGDRGKIFQKFFRSEDQMIRDSAGTGLGLSITKTLVEMQGGKIWFDSEYRQGTTFHFTVPIVESPLVDSQ